MKLQRQKAYKYKNKIHYKYALIIPESTVNKLGWKEGQELETEVKKDRLVVEKN